MDQEDETTTAHGGVLVELPLGDAAPDFNLEKAVCSHGLFMMAPNHWDPHSKTLKRPLRLNLDDDEISVVVQVSHPPHSAHALHLLVFGTLALSSEQQQSLLSQVRRMLRLSEEENGRVIEFHKVHEEAKGRGFGRVFRSPTLFEDMIKCMLLCNCQWSRTLSMAQGLCELQAELQQTLSSASNVMAEAGTTEVRHFIPVTPAKKEAKRKPGVRKCSKNLANECQEPLALETTEKIIHSAEVLECSQEMGRLIPTRDVKEDNLEKSDSWPTSASVPNPPPLEGRENKADSVFFPAFQTSEGTKIGNFPSPRELASLDEKFLAKRCNLGYRAERVINLAREIVEGRIELRELEYACDTLSFSDYDKMAEKLRLINGFGPFTCANVLMCMGYYHVIPTDSETIRHLKQVHAKTSTNRTVQGDVEAIYGKYAPFQFLAYWLEVWQFYEERFGNPSEMLRSSYKLITAANMRPKRKGGNKRKKPSLESVHDGFTERTEA